MMDHGDTRGVLWHVIATSAIGGFLFGLHIGYAGVAMEFHETISDCAQYSTSDACTAAQPACYWTSALVNASCQYTDQAASQVSCIASLPEVDCVVLPHCIYQDSKCQHDLPWTALQRGIFASMMVLGGMVGSLPAGALISRMGLKKVLVWAGAGAFVTGLLFTVGWQMNTDGQIGTYAIMVLGRFVSGASMGFISVAAPIYASEMSPESTKKWTGMVFQVALTFGIFAMALMGWGLYQAGPNNLQSKFQGINATLIVLPIFQVLLGFVILEPSAPMSDADSEAPLTSTPPAADTAANGDVGTNAAAVSDSLDFIDEDVSSSRPMTALQVIAHLKGPIASAVALAAVQQLTGINAIMNYAPTLSKNFGMSPLTGNLAIMTWNFVTCVASLKISTLLAPTKMYVLFAYIASAACLVAAVPTFPAVFPDPHDSTGQALSAIGIALFICAFEMGMGPCFYVLAHALFPRRWSGAGCSFTIVTQFVFNVVINWSYPVAVQDISGGKSADQRKGVASMFLLFGIVGTVSTTVLSVVLARSGRWAEARKAIAQDDD